MDARRANGEQRGWWETRPIYDGQVADENIFGIGAFVGLRREFICKQIDAVNDNAATQDPSWLVFKSWFESFVLCLLVVPRYVVIAGSMNVQDSFWNSENCLKSSVVFPEGLVGRSSWNRSFKRSSSARPSPKAFQVEKVLNHFMSTFVCYVVLSFYVGIGDPLRRDFVRRLSGNKIRSRLCLDLNSSSNASTQINNFLSWIKYLKQHVPWPSLEY